MLDLVHTYFLCSVNVHMSRKHANQMYSSFIVLLGRNVHK